MATTLTTPTRFFINFFSLSPFHLLRLLLVFFFVGVVVLAALGEVCNAAVRNETRGPGIPEEGRPNKMQKSPACSSVCVP
ncbi:hypothetical protein J3F84DRAFT_383541 [Trichoderma pleuroticola]